MTVAEIEFIGLIANVRIEADDIGHSINGDFITLRLFKTDGKSVPYQTMVYSSHAIRSIRMFER